VPLHLGDRRALDLGRRFDAVACRFSALGHPADASELDRAIAAMASHLQPGGVIIVEPWLDPPAWVPGRLYLLTVDEPDLRIARVTVPSQGGTAAIVDFHYLVVTPDGVETLEERMELELLTAAEQLRASERAGLEVEHDPEGLIGRGLFIGRKPAAAV
jgi:hypothetical protein